MSKIPFKYVLTGMDYEFVENISIKQKDVKEIISNEMYNVYLYPLLLTSDYFLERDATVRSAYDGFFKTDKDGGFIFTERGIPLLTYLLMAFQYFFDTKNVKFGLNQTIVIDDKFTITENNYEEIADIIAELNGRKRVKKLVPPEGLNDDQRAIWIKTMKGRQRKAEKEGIELLDIINIVIHFGDKFDYKSVLELTVMQLYNTFSVIMEKDRFNRYYQIYSSGQFELKEHTPHWVNSIQQKNNK